MFLKLLRFYPNTNLLESTKNIWDVVFHRRALRVSPMSLDVFRKTPESIGLAILRLTVAIILITAGIAKLVIPELIMAFEGQLKAAGLFFTDHLALVVPIVELILGYFLIIGKFTRISAGVSIFLMSIAVYIHLVVKDPSLFVFEPMAPIVPILVILSSAVLVVLGAGTWSKDLDIFEK